MVCQKALDTTFSSTDRGKVDQILCELRPMLSPPTDNSQRPPSSLQKLGVHARTYPQEIYSASCSERLATEDWTQVDHTMQLGPCKSFTLSSHLSALHSSGLLTSKLQKQKGTSYPIPSIPTKNRRRKTRGATGLKSSPPPPGPCLAQGPRRSLQQLRGAPGRHQAQPRACRSGRRQEPGSGPGGGGLGGGGGFGGGGGGGDFPSKQGAAINSGPLLRTGGVTPCSSLTLEVRVPQGTLGGLSLDWRGAAA